MQHCADLCLMCSFTKVHMQDYAGLCLMYASKEAEIEKNPGSCLMCSCKEAEPTAAATVCACLTVKHDAACCLTAHSEGNADINASIYPWHHDLIIMCASNVRPITACQQIQHPPKVSLKMFSPTNTCLC